MDSALLEQLLDDAFDHAVVHHGYTNYMRDYEVFVHATADPRTGSMPSHLRYLFRYCVEARCVTSVPAETSGGRAPVGVSPFPGAFASSLSYGPDRPPP